MSLTRRMSPTEILQAILDPTIPGDLPKIVIEAEARWFPRTDEDGEVQAIIAVDGRRFVASLEPLL